MSIPTKLRVTPPYLAFAISMIALYLIYLPGLSGALYYDDYVPFSRLTHVDDLLSALYFVFSDTSGPLGRPISMATFLLHIENGLEDTREILHFNLLIHLTNGLLVAGIAFLLFELTTQFSRRNAWLAAGCGVLWAVLPIHVSTSLIAIQRMAGLAAFFVFAGLLLYLAGLSIQDQRPRRGVTLQATGLGLFTLLAMLAKENGVLLPILALTLETTILEKNPRTSRWRTIRLAFLAGALIALLGYLATYLQDAQDAYFSRDFGLRERLLTEPKILFQYVILAFLPRTFAFHPFHDSYAHIESLITSPEALIAISLLAALGIGALRLHGRFPIPAFAILWFLAAHLLESSVIPLELYFEHRNYVALFGPCFALAWFIGRLSLRFPRLAPAGFVAYLALLAAILLQVTSLWGDRQIAAEMWFMETPGSARATTHLAAYYNNEARAPQIALRILDQNLERCTTCLSVATQAATLACSIESANSIRSRIESILAQAGSVRNTSGLDQMLQGLHDRLKQGNCGDITWRDLEAINLSLLRNSFITHSPPLLMGVHYNVSRIYDELGNHDRALKELEKSWSISNDHGVAYLIIQSMASRKMYKDAANFVENEMCRVIPNHPVLAYAAEKRCNAMKEWIDDESVRNPAE